MIDKDLRSYLEKTEQQGNLLRINKGVDPRTEASALLKSSIDRGKALLFQNIAGSTLPAVGNTLVSKQWTEEVLACGEQGFASWFSSRSSEGIPTVVLESSPVKEVVEGSVDMYQLPIFTFYEKDGGPYITAGIGIQKDPETGRQNSGFYSLQLKGKDRLGLHMIEHTHGFEIFQKRANLGLPTEMAIAIGLHPVELLATSSHTLLDEFELAGALRGEPLEMVKCESIDLDVPAHAEIILEGIILPEKEPEGPIGDWLGYYALEEERHLLQINRITTRKNPIYQSIMAGSAEENLLLSLPREADVLNSVKQIVSGVKRVSLDPFLPICIIQLKKKFEGEPMNAILAAFGEVSFVKVCIAVDEDVDLYNMNDVMWAVTTRTRLENDVNIIKNLMGFSRDPFRVYKSKIAIDATYPLEHEEDFRRACLVNHNVNLDEYVETVNKL